MKDKNKTVLKSMDILNLFRNKAKLTLNEIVELSSTPKTSVHRMIGSLEEMGFIRKDNEGKYSLGFVFLEFGELVKERTDLREIALPSMHSLFDKVGEAVNLVIRDGNESIYIEKLDTIHPVRVYTKIGRRAPLYGGGCSRIILAFLPKKERDEYIQNVQLKQFAKNTITDKNALIKVLEESRKMGYTLSHSELENYSSEIAAPIFDSSNKVIAAISIVGLTVRFQENDLPQLIEEVKKTACEISCKLRY